MRRNLTSIQRLRPIYDLNCVPVGCLTALFLCLVVTGTLMPGSDVPHVGRPGFDKVLHFFAFGILSLFALFDLGRYFGRVTARLYIITALCVTALGGIIELLQMSMQLGRSAEWADLIADAIGAFLLPGVSLENLSHRIDDYTLNFKVIRNGRRIPETVRELYHSAFPPDERRPWTEIERLADRCASFHFTLIRSRNVTAGFITWWRLEHAVYIEHFAIFPSMRSNGLGARALAKFALQQAPLMLILEVEPPEDGEMARRRIGFYERCGFTLHPEIDYIQPPYSEGLQPVRLLLMTYGSGPSLTDTAREIHRRVYGKEN